MPDQTKREVVEGLLEAVLTESQAFPTIRSRILSIVEELEKGKDYATQCHLESTTALRVAKDHIEELEKRVADLTMALREVW